MIVKSLSLFFLGLSILDSGDASERLSKIPLDDKDYTAYSLSLNLQKSDLLLFSAHGEIKNDMGKKYRDQGWNAMFVFHTELCRDSTPNNCFQELTEPRGMNITPGAHYGLIQDTGFQIIEKDLGTVFLNVVVRTASSRARKGDYLDLQPDYGRLKAAILRGFYE